MSKKVTMLIISYNEKQYLQRSIGSCISQTYGNKEILVGDDGSDDGSIEYLQGLDGIKYFVMQRDQPREDIIPSIRVSNVIKRGLEMSDSEYFVILSGDDYFLDDNMLQEAVDFLDSNSDYSAFVSGYRKVSDNGVIEERLPSFKSRARYWSGDYLHISCFVFRRMEADELLSRMCDDTGLQFVLAAKGKWKKNDKAVFAYYQRDASIMHTADPVELAMLELMIYQDIINWKGKKPLSLAVASMSRFCNPFICIRKNAGSLALDKYKKYNRNSSAYTPTIMELANSGIVKFLAMKASWVFFAVLRHL